MRVAFRTIAHRIRDGSIPLMQSVISNWPPSGDMVEVLEAFLPHFTAQDLQDARGEIDDTKRRRRLLATLVLVKALNSQYPPEIKATIASLVIAKLDNILDIAPVTLTPRKGIQQLTEAAVAGLSQIHSLLSFTGTLTRAVTSSPVAIEYLVSSLVAECDLVLFTSTETQLLSVLTDFMDRSASRVHLLDSVSDRPPPATDAFTSKVVSFADVLFQRVRPVQDPSEWIDAFSGLDKIFADLSQDVRFSSSLLRNQFLVRQMRAVLAFVQTFPGYIVQVTSAMVMSLKLAEDHHADYIRLISTPINMGALVLMISALSVAKADRDIGLISHGMMGLVSFMGSRRIQRSMKKALNEVSQHILSSLRDSSRLGFEAWSQFWAAYDLRLWDSTTHRDSPPVFCSNFSHRTADVASPLGSQTLKTCSGCRQVIYCTSICQREDWERVHRSECNALYNTILASEGVTLQMPAYLGPHTLLVIQRLFHQNKHSEIINRIPAHQKLSLSSGEVIYCSSNIEGPELQHFVVPVSMHRARLESFHPWSPFRFDAAVDYVRTTDATRLVAITFRYGFSFLHVLCVQSEWEGRQHKFIVVMMQIENGAKESTT
ncbi:hypothetical protein BKA70DRAFT_1357239 [Coprinopsis sp. MPI-PUGE-AT-0042]|nr:hypothetical protein BKA70DRAFT_1357239 [Coprinopsis sp. MPI-PUGE-AT-0042]